MKLKLMTIIMNEFFVYLNSEGQSYITCIYSYIIYMLREYTTIAVKLKMAVTLVFREYDRTP